MREQNAAMDEALEVTAQIFIRTFAMGVLILLLWAGALHLMPEMAYIIHSSILPISRGAFNTIHYSGMLATKTLISIFFFLPYIAIRWVQKSRST